jgi:hypothetical protein
VVNRLSRSQCRGQIRSSLKSEQVVQPYGRQLVVTFENSVVESEKNKLVPVIP